MSLWNTLKNLFSEIIQELFFTKRFNHIDLAQYLNHLSKYNLLPGLGGLPDKIVFPSEFWQRIYQLHQETLRYNLEFASSVYVVDDDVILTPTIKGNQSNVLIKHKLRWQYKPISKTTYEKIVYADDQIVLKKRIPADKVPKKLKSTYLFSVHTHPFHENYGYSYYSDQDISSLVNGRSYAIGLITDKLHLVFKTDISPKTWIKGQYKPITPSKLVSLGFGVYTGNFSKELEKQNSKYYQSN